MSTTRLTDLAKAILEDTTKIEQHFTSNGLPLPSFDEHSPAELILPPGLRQAQADTIDATSELEDLLKGPVNQIRPVLNATSLNAIYKFNIPASVPLDGEISFHDLAENVGLNYNDLTRIVRFAIVYHRVFAERRPGFVSHSAASRLLADDPSAMAGLGFMFDECYQSFAHTVDALQRFKDPEPHQTGWALAHQQSVPMWTYHTQRPELGQRCALAMKAFTKGFQHDISALTHTYDWMHVDNGQNSKEHRNGIGTIVDLGGADGTVAMALARAHKQLTFVVQDVPEIVAETSSTVPADLRGRLTFAAHDFFTPQSQDSRGLGADVYFFRQIFHNWTNDRCVDILRALIPGLKTGAKVLVNDSIVPPPGVLPPMQERGIRGIDMIMMSLFASRERSEDDWRHLFARADTRFGHFKAWRPEGSHLGLIENTWVG